MAEMFGGPIGELAYNQDSRAAMLSAGQFGETLGRIAMQPAQQRLLEATAGLKEEELASQRAMAELMQGAQGPQAGGEAPGAFSMADQIDKLARAAAGRGLVTQATKLAESSALIRQREASAASSQTTARLNQLKTVGERAELMGQLFGGAQNEEDWVRSNAIFEFQTGQPSPYADVPYSPGLVTSIADQSVKMKDKLELERKRLSDEALQRYRGSRLAQHNTALDIQRERVALERARLDNVKKAGGKGAVGAPTQEEMREVTRLMRLDDIDTDSLDADSLNSTTFAIAAAARELQQGNPALGRARAVQQAYDEAKAAGDLKPDSGTGFSLPFVGKVVGREPRLPKPGARSKPIALPSSARARLKEGVNVTFGNGQTWTLENGQPKRVK